MKEQLVKEITSFYMQSPDCNGIPLDQLASRHRTDRTTLWPLLQELVADGRVDLAFSRVDENPFIRRFEAGMKPPTLELMRDPELQDDLICVYPSRREVETTQDLSAFEGRPFSRRMVTGGAQLALCYFEMAVLDRYFRDPRYRVLNGDLDGSIRFDEDHPAAGDTPAKDKTGIERFGLAWNEERRRAVVVILHDLSDLSPGHQRWWEEHERTDPHRINEPTFHAWFFGQFPTHHSRFEAVIEEIDVLVKFTTAMGREPLFRRSFKNARPPEFRLLLRPTASEFDSFAAALWKMTGENINKRFFGDDVPDHTLRQHNDGTVERVQRGTLAMLRSWLERKVRFRPGEDPIDAIFGPMRRAREARQRPAHGIHADDYDVKFEGEQDQLLADVYDALRTLRLVFANHPAARREDVPDWLYEGRIVAP